MHLMDGPDTSPYVQVGPTTVYLYGGGIENPDYEDEFTAQELILFLLLLEKSCTSPRGYLPAWYLAQFLFPEDYYHMKGPEHAVEQHISNIRRKLGEEPYKPRYLVRSRNKGYKLSIPEGCNSVPVHLLRKLLELLK